MSAKRVCTQEVHDATRSPLAKSPSAAIIGDDLVSALQNVGSRVRKNVSQGYATSRFTTPNASPIRPLAPNPSPIGHMAPGPICPPIFSSVADTLRMVYGASPSPNASPNPSPTRSAKRARVIEDESMERHGQTSPPPIPRPLLSPSNSDKDNTMDVDDDVEDEMLDMTAFPQVKPPRRISPLKRSMTAKECIDVFGPKGDSPVDQAKQQAADISKFAKLSPE